MVMDSILSLSAGIAGLVNLILYLIGISIAWFALGAVKWDLFLHKPRGGKASTLRLLLAIAIGYQCVQFILAYINSTLLLKS
ncbi:hypothetical protein DNHGIG_12360 [Collibacillus ludicampi]|jgi:uncharacterized integral membrane protein (TIGR02327 family)|uniref:DUF1146 domain-containing protein n=1 Tax=Collibacillus ludicampi TaxID=2771369 RepID=A0AAV4LE26_9BACL|nr:DUF1146 domain-containing protein [Collibacillus ludicampi]GIM45687.1 hypothetical protein DNHGIG_12360 [Collibacillus ludicampi]